MYFFISKVNISLQMVKFPGNDIAKMPIFPTMHPTIMSQEKRKLSQPEDIKRGNIAAVDYLRYRWTHQKTIKKNTKFQYFFIVKFESIDKFW